VLESTQLMLAHGLDLFYNRLTPSKCATRAGTTDLVLEPAVLEAGAVAVECDLPAAWSLRHVNLNHLSHSRLERCSQPSAPCPSTCRSFDRLPDDFPYALLTLIVVGMAGATLVLSQLQTRALVKKKWE